MGPSDFRYNPYDDIPTGVEITERHIIPANSPYYIRLNEVPQKTSPSTMQVKEIADIGASVTYGQIFNEVAANPAAGEFWPDCNTGANGDENWNTGLIAFNAADAGKIIEVTYTGTGTLAGVNSNHWPSWYTDRGDGSDGDFVPTGNVTISGVKNYKSVFIKEGVTITIDPYVYIRCQGAFVNEGIVTANAKGMPGGKGGIGSSSSATPGVNGGAGNGGAGGAAAGGSGYYLNGFYYGQDISKAIEYAPVLLLGAGGGGGGAAAGGSGYYLNGFYYGQDISKAIEYAPVLLLGAGGGGGGQGGSTKQGGDGGKGGSCIYIIASEIYNIGNITAKGGNGGAGIGSNSTGGGGGGGGAVIAITNRITGKENIDVSGGVQGGSAVDGEIGIIKIIELGE